MSKRVEESRYNRRLIINAAVLFVFGCALSLVLLFLPSEDYFQYYLTESQKYLEKENYPDMEAQILKATRHAKSTEQWYSLFKRAYLAGQMQNDYSFYASLVQRSRQFLKGGMEHEALNTAGLLWTHQYEKAAASLYAIQDARYNNLIAESLFSYDVYRNYDLEDMTALDFIKEKIQHQEDPDFFESIGLKADNADLLYNAALLSFEDGNHDKAATILSHIKASKINPYRLSVLYYDLGQFNKAYNALQAQAILDDMHGNQRFSIHQQIGDLAHMAGEKMEALQEYEKSMILNPEGSWKLYRNMARIYLDVGYSHRAKAILREGLEKYPGEFELLNDYVVFFHQDYPVEVLKKIQDFRSTVDNSGAAQLLRIRYYPEKKSAVQYQAELWDLFNEDVSNEEVTRFLLWYLAGVGDNQSMKIVLERYKGEGEYPYWYHFYDSVLSLNTGDLESALYSMETVYSMRSTWEFNYNRAILEIIRGDLQRAESLFAQAAEDLRTRAYVKERDIYLANINYNRALILLEDDLYMDAIELLKEAVLLDPMHTRAVTLLHRIE